MDSVHSGLIQDVQALSITVQDPVVDERDPRIDDPLGAVIARAGGRVKDLPGRIVVVHLQEAVVLGMKTTTPPWLGGVAIVRTTTVVPVVADGQHSVVVRRGPPTAHLGPPTGAPPG